MVLHWKHSHSSQKHLTKSGHSFGCWEWSWGVIGGQPGSGMLLSPTGREVRNAALCPVPRENHNTQSSVLNVNNVEDEEPRYAAYPSLATEVAVGWTYSPGRQQVVVILYCSSCSTLLTQHILFFISRLLRFGIFLQLQKIWVKSKVLMLLSHPPGPPLRSPDPSTAHGYTWKGDGDTLFSSPQFTLEFSVCVS